ncbi:PREDICTED: uncharacterized protein LOC105949185 [Erythranthe guttata]|uniref:uncharacterized protein LOC105949185 n=1 Tax=Erythranthe guttata TaxID=4155 RepID=UPI00064D8CEE|nr:PREDICTED: uncharacterized protein LOC105949185 [Erythranthe guttata]|eukprot:XP_012827930.1 PREDICTED: uncharacterized protein LOC105949185 [Erythranthe guttata]
MGFFDLNIPYLESDRNATDKSSLKGRRLKLALKSMELGYTGVAYNRTLKGVMSESHRCSTALFPLSKLIPTSSYFFAAVKLHRDLLNVAVSAPFRQYTRLTVIVDIASQSSTLNAGNPILRSYDIVAVKPMNQNAFDQACQTSEVDMIAIDFSEKLPFKLKQSMVKAAIKRGVYFEITYSGLIANAQSRIQMISNCKLLVDWTRGKNLVFSSAATSATELRGPQDVSNLFSLIGLNTERAKAAISKNCRSLLAKALRKKHFHKEAVKVEEVRPGGQVFDDWLTCDPISSGEGDMLLDDMEQAFALSNTLTQTVKKPIDFSSNMNGLPSHGLQIKDVIPHDSDSSAPIPMEIEKKAEEHDILNSLPENRSVFSTMSKEHENRTSIPDVTEVSLQHVPGFEEGQNSGNNAKIGFQGSGFESSVLSPLPLYNDTCTDAKETVPVSSVKPNHSTDSEEPPGARVDIIEIKTPITNVENQCDLVDKVSNIIDSEDKQETTLASCVDSCVNGEQCSEIMGDCTKLDYGSPTVESFNPTTNFNESISNDVIGQSMQMDSVGNYQCLGKSQAAGREKRKRNSPNKSLLFPLKRNLNNRPLKKKSRK